jgi:RimJ/RimL family protein N-acetyltransferase
MKFVKYGIILHLLKEVDIELVRQWRNDPSVVRNYGFREYITPEMQKEWFKSIYNNNNIYLVIEYEGQKIGVVNAKDVDLVKGTVESGIFIPEGKYSQTFLPGLVMIMTLELGFRMFGFSHGYAHILKSNFPVRSINRSLGYVICPGQENEENQLYEITKERFEIKAAKLIKAMYTITGTQNAGKIIVERSEMDDEVVLGWEHLVRNNGPILNIEETPDERIYHLF